MNRVVKRKESGDLIRKEDNWMKKHNEDDKECKRSIRKYSNQ